MKSVGTRAAGARLERMKASPFDVVMLEVGAFRPSWGDIHLGPDNAVKAHAMLGGAFMPVHWGTFSLAMHAWHQPAERLFELTSDAGALLMPILGQPVEPAHAERAKPWWRDVDSLLLDPAAERPQPQCRSRCLAPWIDAPRRRLSLTLEN